MVIGNGLEHGLSGVDRIARELIATTAQNKQKRKTHERKQS